MTLTTVEFYCALRFVERFAEEIMFKFCIIVITKLVLREF